MLPRTHEAALGFGSRGRVVYYDCGHAGRPIRSQATSVNASAITSQEVRPPLALVQIWGMGVLALFLRASGRLIPPALSNQITHHINHCWHHRMEGAVSSHLLLTPGLLWAALCIWSGLEVCFFIYLHFIVHPRLEPPRQAPQGSLPPREILTRLIDTLDRLRGVSELLEG